MNLQISYSYDTVNAARGHEAVTLLNKCGGHMEAVMLMVYESVPV